MSEETKARQGSVGAVSGAEMPPVPAELLDAAPEGARAYWLDGEAYVDEEGPVDTHWIYSPTQELTAYRRYAGRIFPVKDGRVKFGRTEGLGDVGGNTVDEK